MGSDAWGLCCGPRNASWDSFGNNPGKGEQWQKQRLKQCGQGTSMKIGHRLGNEMQDIRSSQNSLVSWRKWPSKKFLNMCSFCCCCYGLVWFGLVWEAQLFHRDGNQRKGCFLSELIVSVFFPTCCLFSLLFPAGCAEGGVWMQSSGSVSRGTAGALGNLQPLQPGNSPQPPRGSLQAFRRRNSQNPGIAAVKGFSESEGYV